MGMFAVAVGNPFDGISLFGPFSTGGDADKWAEGQHLQDNWWIININHPGDKYEG